MQELLNNSTTAITHTQLPSYNDDSIYSMAKKQVVVGRSDYNTLQQLLNTNYSITTITQLQYWAAMITQLTPGPKSRSQWAAATRLPDNNQH